MQHLCDYLGRKYDQYNNNTMTKVVTMIMILGFPALNELGTCRKAVYSTAEAA